jgi:cell division protein FtsQ
MTAELNHILKRLTGIALLFAAGVMVISAVERKESSEVVEIKVNINPLESGNSLLNDKDILNTIERSFGYPLTALPVGEVDIERLEKVLESDPIIANADAFIGADNAITIDIDQREPLLRIIDNNGLNYYLDVDGSKMPLSKHFSPRVLVATGNIPPHTPDFMQRKRHLLKDLFELTMFIRNDEFLQSMIEQIHLNNRGEFTLVPKIGDHLIQLGRMHDMEDKLSRLKIFYKEGMPYEGWRKYDAVDLRYKGQVVCKR